MRQKSPRANGTNKSKKPPQSEQPASWIPCPVVGIGASAGGLEAFSGLLDALPENTGMAFVLVQHLDPEHESSLAEILGGRTKMPVVQVKDESFVLADHVYVIPPNTSMSISGGKLALKPRGGRRERYMPIDAFFCSLAADQKNNAFGVILSGTASDGTLGLKAIKDEGGITFAQDDFTARFPSMPRNAIAVGAVDFILPPDKIARELASIARHAFPNHSRSLHEPAAVMEDGPEFQRVLVLLRDYSNVDFTHYKHATIKRRLSRRMALHRSQSLGAYIQILEMRAPEVASLFEDLLINVTEFFRDPELFEYVRATIVPELLKDRPPETPIRIWVPACSTGEEVYSLAICVSEAMDGMSIPCPVQIFGTDISESAIEKARAAVYPESTTTVVSAERLRKYFVKLENGYQIHPRIRECCVFSRHNVTKDPPLSRMDVISCRNLLIYLGPVLQKRVITMFHYALRPTGCLVLGASENLGTLEDYFVGKDKRHKVFCRKTSQDLKQDIFERGSAWPRVAETDWTEPSASVYDAAHMAAQKEADRVLLARYAPAGFLVDQNLKIVEFRGRVGPYLGPSPGEASFHLLKLLRDDLVMPVRAAFEQTRRSDELTRKEGVRIRQNGDFQTVALTVAPVLAHNTERHYLVLFEDPSLPWNSRPDAPPLTRRSNGEPPEGQPAAIAQLEEDLASTRDYLQSIIEELRSANEEIQSSNEELQSTNEELQTAKEELQSTNEELTTLNEEMQSRNTELSTINNDLVNLLSSISMPIVMLGSDLRVRRYTPLAEKLFNLIPTDVGRPILDIKPDFEIPDMEEVLLGVIRTLEVHEREVVDKNGRWHVMRVRPYRTTENKIEGVVLQMLEVDELKRSLEDAKAARAYAEAIVDTVREPLIVLDSDLRLQRANLSFYQAFRVSPEETQSRNFFELSNGQWNVPQIHAMLDKIRTEGKLEEVEIERNFERLGPRIILLSGRGIQQEHSVGLILLAIEDVTERRQAEEARYRRLFEAAQDGIMIVSVENDVVEDVNPYVLDLFGYSRQELVGKRLPDLEIFRNSEEVKRAGRAIRDQGIVRFNDLTLTAKGGRSVNVEVVANVYAERSRRVIQFNVRDITDRKRLEQQLRDTAKLESLGLLAGGIAHDFNNLLTGIMGNASLVAADLPPNTPRRNMLDEVVRASQRAADLTRQMLAYAGKGRFVITPVNLSMMIRDITTLIQTSIPRSVKVELNLRDEVPPVEADPGQMQQVVMNLIINAAESIREGAPGTVTVTTSVMETNEQFLRSNFKGEDLNAGVYVCLQVRDSGIGMDEATLTRIFDPFFTTKFTGRGLGLAAVLGIVRGHRGGIRVKSAPGEGTTFEIIFPAAEPKAFKARAVRPRKDLQGSGTVLVIDDEEVIRQTARAALERYGYHVLLANDGENGIAKFRSIASDVSLVILDVTMPVMAGLETLRQIRQIRQDARILLSSGYNESEAIRNFKKEALAGFIQKPYTAVQLAEKVKAALEKQT